ncbi:MAG: hypothetical protein KGZ88_10325 [Methylomicrobium sp.]|nr:hypothetical protein [Methylomicrobium sp.]
MPGKLTREFTLGYQRHEWFVVGNQIDGLLSSILGVPGLIRALLKVLTIVNEVCKKLKTVTCHVKAPTVFPN